VSPDLLLLIVFMFAVTYPSRAVPLLIPGVDRLPPWALTYLRLVGPAILAALAAASVLVVPGDDGAQALHLGIEALAVAACAALVAWQRNLFIGLTTAVAIVALARLTGLG
jgi:branched-subunit amino acid transport protein